MAELRAHAAAQAALFNVGFEESRSSEEPATGSDIRIKP